MLRGLLYELVQSGILSEDKTEEYKEIAYQPARDTQGLSIKSVIDALENRGVDDIPVGESKELKSISAALEGSAWGE